MGFSPSDGFTDKLGHKWHLEGGSAGVVIWYPDESAVLMTLDFSEARKLLDDLQLLVGMADA
jgi:hypothetical protein